jgi:hypothetical protein
MVDQMLFKLLSELAAEGLYVVELFGYLLPNLQDLFINISRQEMCPLSRVLGSFFDVFDQFLHGLLLCFLKSLNLIHCISNQPLIQIFALLISL